MITVACVWVKGNVPYSVDYVTRLYSMVARHYAGEFEFTCFTDQAEIVGPAIARMLPLRRFERTRIVAIPSPEPLAGWWSKLELFNPANATALCKRVLYLDLDVLPVADLRPVIEFKPYPRALRFALAPPGGSFKPKGFRTVTRYNSSVMVFEPSERLARLYTDFDPKLATLGYREHPITRENAGRLPLWGDQDWIGEHEPDADIMPAEWFPRLGDLMMDVEPMSAALIAAPGMGARVVLVKKPKPHVAAAQWPWFAEAWR